MFLYTAVVGLVILYLLMKLYQSIFPKMIKVKGQCVLITGCDTGFGHGLAQRLDGLGFSVIASCLDPSGGGAKSLVAKCSKSLHVIGLDVSRDDSVAAALKSAEKIVAKSKQGLWAVVNNAGIDFACDVELCSMDVYHKVAEVNLFGIIRVTKAFLPMIRATKGRVINVTSVKGRICLPYVTVYGLTKYGGENFSDALRMEMVKFGVKVIIVEPGEYGGVTEIVKGKNHERIKKEFDKAWKEASDEIKEAYGRDYFFTHQSRYFSDDTFNSMTPVLDAFVDAIMNENPKPRYLIDGSSGWIDRHCLYARLYPYLPESWMDYLILRWYTKGMPDVKANQRKQ